MLAAPEHHHFPVCCTVAMVFCRCQYGSAATHNAVILHPVAVVRGSPQTEAVLTRLSSHWSDEWCWGVGARNMMVHRSAHRLKSGEGWSPHSWQAALLLPHTP